MGKAMGRVRFWSAEPRGKGTANCRLNGLDYIVYKWYRG